MSFSAENPFENVDVHVSDAVEGPPGHQTSAGHALRVTVAHTVVRNTTPRTCIVPQIVRDYDTATAQRPDLPPVHREVIEADPDTDPPTAEQVVFDFDKRAVAEFVLARVSLAEAATFFDVAETNKALTVWHKALVEARTAQPEGDESGAPDTAH